MWTNLVFIYTFNQGMRFLNQSFTFVTDLKRFIKPSKACESFSLYKAPQRTKPIAVVKARSLTLSVELVILSGYPTVTGNRNTSFDVSTNPCNFDPPPVKIT